METTPRSAGKSCLASAITALNVVVASGFSIAGLIKPELVLPTGATPTDASALLIFGLLAGIIQFADVAVGLFQHDVGKTVGPLFLAILQAYAVTIFWKASKAISN